MPDNHTQQPFVPLRPSEDTPSPAFSLEATVTPAEEGASETPQVVVVQPEPHEREERIRVNSNGSRATQRRPNLSSRFFDAMSGHRKVEEPVSYQGPVPGGIGPTLRAHREAMGLTPYDVSDRLKFPHQSISALEEERWDDLQEGFLLRALVRQYAELVGLDPNKAVELLNVSRGGAQEEPQMRYMSHTNAKSEARQAQSAAQKAAYSIPYNVNKTAEEIQDAEAAYRADAVVSEDPVEVPAPVYDTDFFEGSQQKTFKTQLNAAMEWAQDRQNLGLLVAAGVIVLLVIVILVLLFS